MSFHFSDYNKRFQPQEIAYNNNKRIKREFNITIIILVIICVTAYYCGYRYGAMGNDYNNYLLQKYPKSRGYLIISSQIGRKPSDDTNYFRGRALIAPHNGLGDRFYDNSAAFVFGRFEPIDDNNEKVFWENNDQH